MDIPHLIDLHLHSNVSDGTDSPAELLDHVREAGLGLFALTDHDGVKGCLDIRALLQPGDPFFLCGAEFSCRDEAGKYHILGYGFDPEAGPIRALVENAHSLRMQKLRARLDFLRDTFGFRFSEEELRELLSMDNPGKPHIANLMVRHGYAETKELAIHEFINRIHFRREFLSPQQAIGAILAAGGVPVLAHPSYGDGDQLILGEEMDARLQRLTGFGLQGVEAYYSGFTARLNREMLAFAARYGLYVTAGSDYHGKNKLVRLGDTGLADAAEGPEGLRRFWDEMRKRLP